MRLNDASYSRSFGLARPCHPQVLGEFFGERRGGGALDAVARCDHGERAREGAGFEGEADQA